VISSTTTLQVQRLVDAKIDGEIWADGSFLTEKIDPKDVDVIVRIDGHAVYDKGTSDGRDEYPPCASSMAEQCSAELVTCVPC
jgi:hypothetical protein